MTLEKLEVYRRIKTGLTKAANRNLITEETRLTFKRDINQLGRMLNACIKTIGTTNDQ